MLVSPTNCTTREGNEVSQSRLPVSLHQCPGGPSATTYGHHRWDWALPHASRKQRTHSWKASQHGTNASFTPHLTHVSSRFSDCGHAAAVNEATLRRSSSPTLAALHPTRLPKRPRMVFQLRALQPPNPSHHWLPLLLDHGLAAPPAH